MKYVLVTGANGGLGFALTKQLLSEEYTVFACDLKAKGTENSRIKYFDIDVTDEESIERVKTVVYNITDSLYAVINLAGIFTMQSIVEGDSAALKRIIDINFWGTYNVNRAFLSLIEKGKGRIINMSSEIGRYSIAPFNGYYALSKHLVDGYSDVLRRELAYSGTPVIKIQAGSFKTNMLKDADGNMSAMIQNSKRFGVTLGKMSGIVAAELNKQNHPDKFAKLVSKILRKRKPKARYKTVNSFKLSLMDALPERLQDKLYLFLPKFLKEKK